MSFLILCCICLLAYGIGSLSTAIIVCRVAKLPDPRQEGSKNPGATNVMRLGGKKLAAITLLGDALKGFIPVYLIKLFFPEQHILIGSVMVSVFLGHLYPIFFHFKGGKGVATFIGVLMAMSYTVGGMFLLTWFIIAAIFRISSLAAIIATILAPFYTLTFMNFTYALFVAGMAVFIILRHKSNIERLRMGTEPKMGA